uniref:Putative secreted protein n=1 Tax=Anopheles triannulatus TaxID=58253 RepID=A0A2M4B096_9DIPT
MRLTVLICLYLTFLEASVGSLIYPERSIVQLFVEQSRVMAFKGQPPSTSSSPPVDALTTTDGHSALKSSTTNVLEVDGTKVIEVHTEAPLKKLKRRPATKKAAKRLIPHRGSVRPRPGKT